MDASYVLQPGWLTKLMSPLGKILTQKVLLESLTFMVLKALKLAGNA